MALASLSKQIRALNLIRPVIASRCYHKNV